MSKIQFNELNQLEVLNREETTEVVGGYYYYYPSYSYYSDDDVATVYQQNANFTQQLSFGGYAGNSNNTSQSNNATIYQ